MAATASSRLELLDSDFGLMGVPGVKGGRLQKGTSGFLPHLFCRQKESLLFKGEKILGGITPVNTTLDRRWSFSIDLPLASSKPSGWIYNDGHTRSNLRNNLGRNLFLEPYRRPKDLIYVETGG